MEWDKINFNVPKGYKAAIEEMAASQNRNVTLYLKNLVDEDFRRAGRELPGSRGDSAKRDIRHRKHEA